MCHYKGKKRKLFHRSFLENLDVSFNISPRSFSFDYSIANEKLLRLILTIGVLVRVSIGFIKHLTKINLRRKQFITFYNF